MNTYYNEMEPVRLGWYFALGGVPELTKMIQNPGMTEEEIALKEIREGFGEDSFVYSVAEKATKGEPIPDLDEDALRLIAKDVSAAMDIELDEDDEEETVQVMSQFVPVEKRPIPENHFLPLLSDVAEYASARGYRGHFEPCTEGSFDSDSWVQLIRKTSGVGDTEEVREICAFSAARGFRPTKLTMLPWREQQHEAMVKELSEFARKKGYSVSMEPCREGLSEFPQEWAEELQQRTELELTSELVEVLNYLALCGYRVLHASIPHRKKTLKEECVEKSDAVIAADTRPVPNLVDPKLARQAERIEYAIRCAILEPEEVAAPVEKQIRRLAQAHFPVAEDFRYLATDVLRVWKQLR